MNTMRLLPILFLLALLAAAAVPALAAPRPPVLVVNHETKECGETFGGDECMDCIPVEGWEVLGLSSEVQCPAGYTAVDGVDYTCQPFKNPFCCSEGHSGAPGDCEDLVVNHGKDQCAFVDDIQTCELAANWEPRPGDLEPAQWVCPFDYEWIDTLSCKAEGEKTDSSSPSLPCLSAIAVLPVVAGAWLLVRRLK